MGSYFGPPIVKKISKGRIIASELGAEQPQFASNVRSLFTCPCGQTFNHKPAWTIHLRFCAKGALLMDVDAGVFQTRTDQETAAPQAASEAGENNEHQGAGECCEEGALGPSTRPSPPAPSTAGKKMRKDGITPKQSGLREGQHRQPYTLYFKFLVAQEYDALLKKKELGTISDPLARAVSIFNGLPKSNVFKWHRQMSELRRAVTHGTAHLKRTQKDKNGKIIALKSAAARRMTLHGGRGAKYAAAEEELYKQFKDQRALGKRVNERWLCVSMKKILREVYGDFAADEFRASYGWVWRFAARFNISLRRATNHKHQSVAERLPKIKRWLARLRLRLNEGPEHRKHPVWGRWLPCNRLSVDQVPCNFREGARATYDTIGVDRVWLAGTKADDGKRFCTLQIVARAANGPASRPRHGQPKLGIIFRGQGKRISQQERNQWHRDVHVRFQPKAWADAEYCELHAREEMAEATEEARLRGEESVVFYDNLHGQTTDEHERALKRNRAVRHLLPSGVTSEIQLIDDGIGYAVKNEMGHALDKWLEEGNNLSRWTGEGTDGLAMWEKRVLITNIAAEAWEAVSSRFDFERAATRIGMRITADGSGDDKIKIQGVDNFTFCEADADIGGACAQEDGRDPVEEAVVNEAVVTDKEDEHADGSCNENNENEVGVAYDSSDSEDDTAALVADTIGRAPEQPPSGFEYMMEPPKLESEADMKALIGKYILHAFQLENAMGWFLGKVVAVGVSNRDLKKTPTATHVVLYEMKHTKNKHLVGRVASTLSSAKYGVNEWWVLLHQQSG